MDDWYVGDEFGIAGNFDLTAWFDDDGALEGVITAGTFTLSLPQGIQVGATAFPPGIVDNLHGTVSADANGNGMLFLVLQIPEEILEEHFEWGTVFGSVTALRLPIQIDSAYNITFNYTGVLKDMYPHEPWPASDYDGNGILGPEADFDAFMAGFLAQEHTADSNGDGEWDQEDIDLWWIRFQEDYDNQ
jgi:hypothetical protein